LEAGAMPLNGLGRVIDDDIKTKTA